MENNIMCNSWAILDRQTNTPVMEFFNPELLDKVNRVKYYTMTTLEWLQMFNRRVKETLH